MKWRDFAGVPTLGRVDAINIVGVSPGHFAYFRVVSGSSIRLQAICGLRRASPTSGVGRTGIVRHANVGRPLGIPAQNNAIELSVNPPLRLLLRNFLITLAAALSRSPPVGRQWAKTCPNRVDYTTQTGLSKRANLH